MFLNVEDIISIVKDETLDMVRTSVANAVEGKDTLNYYILGALELEEAILFAIGRKMAGENDGVHAN